MRSVSVSFAFGIAAPLASVTWPRNSAVELEACANEAVLLATIIARDAIAITNVILILCFIRVSPLLAARDLPFDRRRQSATCCDELDCQAEKLSASPS